MTLHGQKVIIVGAGIVGLHMAQVFHEKGAEVFVLEQEPYLAAHTSGRNTGVIHAGIFYKPNSLKEKLCIEGNSLTYEWLRRLNVPHKNCGKWIIPKTGEEKDLDPFIKKTNELPIPKPQVFKPRDLKLKEPNLRSTSIGILIPSTGILDAASYIKNLALFLETKGIPLILNCQVQETKNNRVMTTRGEMYFDLALNCAGLFSDELAQKTGLSDYQIKPCRGDYYVWNDTPISKPVYQLPNVISHGLGVHLTPTLDHQTLLGPNSFFIENKIDYVHHSNSDLYESFLKQVLSQTDLPKIIPGYSGNRPKLFYKNEPVTEFTLIKNKNWIHVLGIESPGLTAAPALARHVLALL